MFKRIMCAILALLCLTLCACGKSTAVKETEAAIAQIGAVTMDSKNLITYAESLYEALPEDEKADVENYDLLASARQQYNKLVAGDAVTKIEAINMTNPNENDALNIAKAAYDAVPESAKSLVTNVNKLETAQKLADVLITNYASVSAYKVNLFKEDVNTWYSDLDAAATAFVCFWLQLYYSDTIDVDEISFSPCIAINKDDGRVDVYSGYGDDGIIGIQYWPDAGNAQVGTVKTDMELSAYLDLLTEGGIIDEYQSIPLTNIAKIINLMS